MPKNTCTKEANIKNPRAWIVVACSALFYCYQFVVRVSPNMVADELRQTFLIDASTFGLIIGFYYWSYSGIQIPLGIIMDRIGTRRLVSGAGIVVGIGCYMFAHTDSIIVASIARFLMGLGAACGFVGTLKLGSLWFPPRWMGIVIGLTMVFGTLGAVLGQTPLRILVEAVGWQETYTILSIVGCALGVLTYTVVRNSPAGDKLDYDDEGDENPFSGLFKVMQSPQAWIIAAFGMLMYVPLTVMGVAWGVPFLENAYGMDEKVAGTITSVMFLGGACGGPVFALFSDFLCQRRMPMIIGGLGSLSVYFFILYYEHLPLFALHTLFFLAGFFYTSKTLTFAAQVERMPLRYSAISVAFTNMIVMFTGIICHPLIGFMLDFHWDGTVDAGGTPIYSAADYRFALTVVPVALALSLLSIAFYKETHPANLKRKRYDI